MTAPAYVILCPIAEVLAAQERCQTAGVLAELIPIPRQYSAECGFALRVNHSLNKEALTDVLGDIEGCIIYEEALA